MKAWLPARSDNANSPKAAVTGDVGSSSSSSVDDAAHDSSSLSGPALSVLLTRDLSKPVQRPSLVVVFASLACRVRIFFSFQQF